MVAGKGDRVLGLRIMPGGRRARKGLGRAQGVTGLCLQRTRDRGAGVGGAWGLGAMGTGAWMGHRELEDMTVML